jgi:N-methylhydantoinase A
MERAIRVISIERGHDPRDYTLVAFGGAGALHACELAAALRMPRVLVPCFPGGLSALGILRADVVRDVSRTVRLTVLSLPKARAALEPEFARMERRGFAELRREGFAHAQMRAQRLLDMRYVGQAYELTVPAQGDFVADFHRAHEQRYGYADPGRQVEVVNVRARIIGGTSKPRLDRMRPGAADARDALLGFEKVAASGGRRETPVYSREKLRAGNRLSGPAIISEYSATTYLAPGWRAKVDVWGNLILERSLMS